MALFTDGPINGTTDLQNYENAILDVASTEKIDLSGKIALAQDEIASELTVFLLRRLPLRDLQWTMRRSVGVSDVAVTASLRQWHAHKALALVYRDAFNSQLNDRYRSKWKEYEQLAKTSSENYFQIGVGLVAGLIAKAAVPVVATLPGAGTAATYYVAVGWLNQAGQEGGASDTAQISTSNGQQLVVEAQTPPANVTGWNAYVGNAPDTISLQNAGPIAAGSSWTMPVGLKRGRRPGQGQQPTSFLVDQHVMERG